MHPPGGGVGGDTLHIDAELGEAAHALITTPGATRFYRSAGEPALQSVAVRVAADARLEWLPLENIVHSGALAENRLLGWGCHTVLAAPLRRTPKRWCCACWGRGWSRRCRCWRGCGHAGA